MLHPSHQWANRDEKAAHSQVDQGTPKRVSNGVLLAAMAAKTIRTMAPMRKKASFMGSVSHDVRENVRPVKGNVSEPLV